MIKDIVQTFAFRLRLQRLQLVFVSLALGMLEIVDFHLNQQALLQTSQSLTSAGFLAHFETWRLWGLFVARLG